MSDRCWCPHCALGTCGEDDGRHVGGPEIDALKEALTEAQSCAVKFEWLAAEYRERLELTREAHLADLNYHAACHGGTEDQLRARAERAEAEVCRLFDERDMLEELNIGLRKERDEARWALGSIRDNVTEVQRAGAHEFAGAFLAGQEKP